jgi:HSP20 family molecular chaperone IbpA
MTMFKRPDATEWMWAQACDLVDQAERMHRQFFRLAVSQRSQALWEPPADVFENDGEIVVVVALPGVVADRVEVTIEQGGLRVRAERPLPFAGARDVVRQLEIPYGVFERRIPLPDQDVAADPPDLTHGCLVVRLRKKS